MFHNRLFLFATALFTITISILFPKFGFCYTPPEIRAVWVNADALPTDDKQATDLISRYAKANINVILPEVICRGYAVYPSSLIGRDPRFEGKPDPLALLIAEAKKNNIEVHPWVWVFRAGYTKDRGWILKNHPDWVERDKYGDDLSANGGLWISPAIPEAREYMLSLLAELTRKYDIDGIHLDYIRYETQSPVPYGYNPVSTETFFKLYGKDPSTIDRLTSSQLDWNAYREDLVNTFVHRVALQTRYLKPNVKLSAAVAPDISSARLSLLQNWRHWVANKWIDFITPMAYFSDDAKFRNAVKLVVNTVEDKTLIAPGLGLHLMKNAPQIPVSQTLAARELGGFGETAFAASYLTDDMISQLAAGPYSEPAAVPFRNVTDNMLNLVNAAKTSSDPFLTSCVERYSRYIAYMSTKNDYIAPMRPPLNIPTEIIPLPTITAKHITTPIILDGNLDEECWANADKASISYTSQGENAPESTTVMTCWDDSSLYVAFVADDDNPAQLTANTEKRDGPVFYDDSVEVFVDPSNIRRTYFHLSTNSKGILFDQRILKAMDVSWNGDWKCAVKVNEKNWVVEYAIPFTVLGVSTPSAGNSWAINFTRNIPTKPAFTYLNWAVVYGSFHSPDRFGTITFQ